MARSRTKNVSINMIVALACQAINLVLSFVSRTIFINVLGADYLGVNGLFSNVLTILSFAELGIGSAIVYSMYKPLAVGDTDKLGSLMALYKKAYRAIGIFVAVAGLCVTPFLDYIIKNKPNISENLSLLYLLFLFNTVASYFFVYKKSIIIADQKNYLVLTITEIVHVIQIVAQAVFLVLTHNFLIYLILQVGCTVLENIIAAVVANKMYPFLKQKATPLSREESKNIFKNVRALALYRFGSVILNGTDNILVSALVGVTEVGLVSNYVLLNSSCNAILTKITGAFTASIGNLNAISDDKKKYDVFNKILFISAWLYGYVSVGLLTVTKLFITTWIGNEYLLDTVTNIAIVAGFYVAGMQFATYTYRTTLGYFVQGRIAPLCAAILNILLSVLLCKWIGLAGIFIATPISRFFTNGLVDPILIYKYTFRKNPISYYIKYFAYILLFICIGIICELCVVKINIGGWLGVILDAGVVTLIFNGIMLLIFCRTKMFKELAESFMSLIRRKSKKDLKDNKRG